MGCEQVNLNLTPLSFVNLSGFKPQALTILLKLSTSPLFGLSHKLAYGFLTSLLTTGSAKSRLGHLLACSTSNLGNGGREKLP